MLNKTIIALSLGLLLLFNFCFAQENCLFQGQINTDNVNIRTDSTVSSEVICNIENSQRVEVTLELYEWYKIRLPKTAPSYILKNLVVPMDDKTGKVLKNRVNIRLHPNQSSPILGQVNQNEIINILAYKGEWYKIEPVNNSFGWIHKKFVDKAVSVKKDEIKTAQIIEEGEGGAGNKLTIGARENEMVTESPSQDKTINIEGIIKPYGKFFRRIATHKLICKDGNIFLLKGKKETLNALNHRKVKITGKLIITAKQKYPIIEISKIEALD